MILNEDDAIKNFIDKIKKTDSFGTWKFYSIEFKNIGELTIEEF